MKRIVSLVSAVVLLLGISAFAQDKAAKTQSMSGAVKAVTQSSITVESGGKSMTFSVSSKTKLLAKGSTAKTKEKKAAGAPGLVITDMVKEGASVVVRYSGTDALEVRVR